MSAKHLATVFVRVYLTNAFCQQTFNYKPIPIAKLPPA